MESLHLDAQTLADSVRTLAGITANHVLDCTIRMHTNLQCVYVRPIGERFELVAQWIAMVGDDFTFEEEVIATADTPNKLPLFSIGRDFVMPPAPWLRER
jgi:hypothetical protein